MKYFILMFCLLFSFAIQAQHPKHNLYIGIGNNNETENGVGGVAFAFGATGSYNKYAFGFEVGIEGDYLDCTGRCTGYEKSLSINLPFGYDVLERGDHRIRLMVMIGMKREAESCPRSYLGFECYADREPDIDWEFNYGGIAMYTFKKVTMGVRYTPFSQQALIGLGW